MQRLRATFPTDRDDKPGRRGPAATDNTAGLRHDVIRARLTSIHAACRSCFVLLTLRTVLATGLIGLCLTGTATAQTRYLGADGPVVLPTDLGTGRPIPDDPRAIPIPQVMNGGGFGLTGTDYFSDGITEGPLNKPHRPREFVLAPARIGPPDFRR